MTRVTLVCTQCDATARRDLMYAAGCRGVHETPSEPALCPNGHGEMVRKDGSKNDRKYAHRSPLSRIGS